MAPRLIILGDSSPIREVTPAEEPLEVGRAPDVEVLLDDRSVSRRHAVIRMRGRRVLLEDVGSTFGTFVNGRAIRSGDPVALLDGDIVRFGRVEMLCKLDNEQAAASVDARDAAFAVEANARLIALEEGLVRKWPVSSPVTLIGSGPHCDVRLQDSGSPPEQALLRALQRTFRLEPRSQSQPPRLNESQHAVTEPVTLDSGDVILARKAQLLFLYDFGPDGCRLPDPLLDFSRRQFLEHVAGQSRLAPRYLRRLCRNHGATGRNLGEVLVEHKVVTPLFWRVISNRLLASSPRSNFLAFRGRRQE